jgi:Kef-type K+ transport system membrane component KefB
MAEGNFGEIAALLALAAAVGALALRLRQPLIVAFIAVGLLAGPSVLGWVHAHDEIDLLAQLGIAVLLFVVGLKLDLTLVRHLGPVALATGIGQLAFTIVFGFALALGLGMDWVKALYVAVALTFSSTIIIVKLLSDKREIDSLHGRIAVGFLIVQDIAVVIAMMIVGSWTTGASAWATGAVIVVKLVAALAVIGLLMRFVLPPLLRRLARSQELLLLFGVAWGVALAAVGEALGFSREVGAFLAGFSLASTEYREALSTRLTTLRDFLLLFFFIDLGSRLDLGMLGGELGAAVVFSLFVLIGNPLIVLAIMGAMGYRKRTGFLAGLTVAQISEFSIVFVAMGISLGHVSADALGLVTLVGLVTITTSTYMILYSERLYELCEPWLGIFERRRPARELALDAAAPDTAPEVIVFGLGRYGGRLLADLHERGVRALGIDFDPEAVRELRGRGLDTRFGDAEDLHLLEHLPLTRVRAVVSTLPQADTGIALLRSLQALRFDGQVVVAARSDPEAALLAEAGAMTVLRPYRDAADYAAARVLHLLDAGDQRAGQAQQANARGEPVAQAQPE